MDAPRQRDRPRILCRFSSTHWSCAQVYGGYEGCVGENGYLPCAQDGFGGLSATDKFYLYNTSTGECTETGKTMTTRAFWVLWGHPQDKYELTKRTGLNPVVTFPFNRGPYPSMLESGGDHGDDAADARETAKDLLVYLGAFTETEIGDWDVAFTEGAEQGHIQNIAAAATPYLCANHDEQNVLQLGVINARRWALVVVIGVGWLHLPGAVAYIHTYICMYVCMYVCCRGGRRGASEARVNSNREHTQPRTHAMLGLVQVVQSFSGAHPVQKEIVQKINTNKASSWVAEDPHRNVFANRSLSEIKGMMGLIGMPLPDGS